MTANNESVLDELARRGLEELLRLRYEQGLRDGRCGAHDEIARKVKEKRRKRR